VGLAVPDRGQWRLCSARPRAVASVCTDSPRAVASVCTDSPRAVASVCTDSPRAVASVCTDTLACRLDIGLCGLIQGYTTFQKI
jgi:hypothetical protein